MKDKLKYISILVILSFLIILKLSIAEYPDGNYEVGRIIDGDTFELKDGEKVRLIGINTPEIGEECTSEATQKLSSLISGKSVRLEKDVSETDKYGRLLRYVYIDSTFVNETLAYGGYAWAIEYPPDTKYASQLEDAEQSAKNNNRGCLWARAIVCPSGCYVHITRTGEKYHTAGCRYLSQSDISICRDDAIAQGYTPCSVCGGKCDSSSEKDGCFIDSQ